MKKRKKALDVYTQNQILFSVIYLLFILGFIIVCLSPVVMARSLHWIS